MRGGYDKVRWLGWLLALGLPIVFWWQWLLPRQESLSGRQHDIELLRAEVRHGGETEQASSPQIQLSDLVQRLGTPEQLPGRVERLHDLLRDYGVVLLKAGYKLVPGELGRYEIQLDVEGPYYGVRLFLRSMLTQDEAIALESIDLRRPPGGSGKIRAAMRWVMFVKATGP